jgi:hypothetical protein
MFMKNKKKYLISSRNQAFPCSTSLLVYAAPEFLIAVPAALLLQVIVIDRFLLFFRLVA